MIRRTSSGEAARAGGRVAIGVTPQGLEFRIGEFWAAGWDDLEPTDDPWVTEGIERTAGSLRRNIDSALMRRAERSARESAPMKSTAALVIDYFRDPDPGRFEQHLSRVAVWVDHRDDDDAVVAQVARRLPAGSLTLTTVDTRTLRIGGPGGERTVTPTSRDVTLRAIAAVLKPDIELWRWTLGEPADTLAIIVLTADDRRRITGTHSQRALDAQFRRIGARSKMFGG